MKKSDILAAQLAKALEEETRIAERYGEDHEDKTVIAFRAMFVPNGRVYDYSAIRAEGLWYTTGPRTPKGFTWAELIAWMDGLPRVSKIDLLREGAPKKVKKARKLKVKATGGGCPSLVDDLGGLFGQYEL